MTTHIVPHPNTEPEPLSIHVVPLNIDNERAIALLDRYVEVVESGEHPPYWYIGQVFAELYRIGRARRAAEVVP